MNKNIDRVFRQRRLSADEVVRDEEIRRKVRAEFPPAAPRCIIGDMKTLDASVLDRLLDPVGRILTTDVARDLINLRFDRKAQARIDRLARKCNEGKLTDAERSEYETYVYVIDFIAVLQAKAKARLKQSKDA